MSEEVALFGLVMAVGVVGTVIPFVPGLTLVWGAGLVYGLLNGFGLVGGALFALMTLLLAGGTVATYVLPGKAGANRGASTSTLVVGALAGIAGFFLVPVVGLPLGAVIGVLLAERRRTRSWPDAWHRTKGVMLGFGIGVLVEFGAAVAMVLAWAAWVIWG